ncbi:MAG: DUF494 domain-containing protein [Desulfuromonadales bacterium]|nr:DUF494 domain-containing protein [Desulfuromonadales bacterium]
MSERVLAIVNLIAHYVMGTEDTPVCEKELVTELISAGYGADEINAAFQWMESAAFNSTDSPEPAFKVLNAPSYRIFSDREQQLLSLAARGFLIRVRAMGLLPDPVQEEIIERAIRTAVNPVTEQEIKLITGITLLLRADDIWSREIGGLLERNWERSYH